ncbi:MAG: MmgE/PrpD family protein [Acidobacteria bacterium]|nr:MmgE/PrpD family protein [Acidobacteriota bacterium]MCI0621830.1 MmgE/PrpD family protein [Acidobacteriota bacterium]MCI0718888.1 MmgE/PrpD family protein [Acidobacteriota bacterium]
MNASSQGMTDRFAEFVENFSFEQLPAPVISQAKEVLYDGLGCLLAATSPQFDIGEVLRRFVRETGGTPESQIFGTALRTNCVTAALVNGALGYYCDIESHHPGAIMHAIAVVGPAALAVGERQRSSGRDVLAAIVLGIDVACRVSYALSGPALYARGFHPTCVAGTFGSLAAGSHLLGLKGRSLRHAFGLAGTEASGLLAWVSDPTEHSRPFNMGLASRHGVFAAHLASCGFGGPPAIFEGKYPLGQAFTGQWNEAALFDGLGEKFKIMELYFKLYACCAFIHPALDGFLDIGKSEGLRPDDIHHITLRFPKSGYKVIDNNALRSHCAQYVLALAAHKGRVEFYDILNDQRSDPSIRSLSERITVIGDEEVDRTYPDLYRSIIVVETKGGTRHTRDVTYPKGSPENPLSHADLKDKFSTLTREVLTPQQGEEIAQTISQIEELEEISTLIRLLRRGSDME